MRRTDCESRGVRLPRRRRPAPRPGLTARSFLAILVVGILLAVGGVVRILTGPPPVSVTADVPILQVDSTTTTEVPTTTTEAPAPDTTTTTAAPVVRTPRPAATGAPRPAAPPKNAYAPEPIVEIGTIEIPKIGLNHRIFHGITMRNIDNGPSHWPGTAYPGQVGNAVFAGHRVTKTRPFRNIDQMSPGDKVYFTVDGVRTEYEMTSSEVVPPSALRIVEQTPTATATLFACHPPGSAKFRYVVYLKLVTDEAASAGE